MLPLVLALALVMGDDPTTPKSVAVEGKKVPVRVLAPQRTSSAEPKGDARADVVATLPLDGAMPFVLALRDETIVRTWRMNDGASRRHESDLFRVAKDGTIKRFALPVNDREWYPAVCAKRWLVMVLESEGTLIFDLASDALVAKRPQFGGFGNAQTSAPACSPDGRFAAISTPYGGRVTVVRLEDGVVVTNIPVEAPGRVSWTGSGIGVRTQMLPYE